MIPPGKQIRIEKDDSPKFIESVNKILSLLIFQYGIHEICTIKIKNWFDHKWLNYSGTSVVPFESGGVYNEAALEDQWREKTTVPPFNPNRVISEKYFRKQNIANKTFEKTIHKKRTSNNNIHHRISDYTKNGLFLWYSSNSEINQRGSLMVYRIQDDEVQTWYATFENLDKWKITKAKGIGLSELNAYLK